METTYTKKDLQKAQAILKVKASEVQIAVFINEIRRKAAEEAYYSAIKENKKFKSIQENRIMKDFNKYLQWKDNQLNMLNKRK